MSVLIDIFTDHELQMLSGKVVFYGRELQSLGDGYIFGGKALFFVRCGILCEKVVVSGRGQYSLGDDGTFREWVVVSRNFKVQSHGKYCDVLQVSVLIDNDISKDYEI